ncbi:hypothetical protein ASPCAL14907 [Aspergillus calidoustus]|uniref:Uncharacterized protein n=1 Tax=Aspergillus calidoustus TaxID=454130 RepID=A0A0U5GJ52_ASPCI|nr:hypothetical protein ASPCAL14907 [Aspergillus calidoustus]
MDDLLSRCNQSVKLALLVAESGRSVDQCRRDSEGVGQSPGLRTLFPLIPGVEIPRWFSVPMAAGRSVLFQVEGYSAVESAALETCPTAGKG